MAGKSDFESQQEMYDEGPIEDEHDEDNEDFYFESDHLALRGNADYRSVLRTIVILESQRIEATKHIDVISVAERKALEDPEAFLQKLKSGDLNLPGRINIQNVSSDNFKFIQTFQFHFAILSVAEDKFREI